MGETDINVIMNELKHIRQDITDMREQLKSMCPNCTRAALLQQSVENLAENTDTAHKFLWGHTYAQWTVIAAVGLALLYAFISHVFGVPVKGV